VVNLSRGFQGKPEMGDMNNAKHEPITESRGTAPSTVQGQSRWSEIRGEAP